MKGLIAILLFLITNTSCAQYVHYEDKRNINSNSKPAKQSTNVIARVSDPAKPEIILVKHIRDSIPPKGEIIALNLTSVTIDSITPLPDSAIVYHKWPDRCPGTPGSIPVLMNYVPPHLVPKLVEIYKGHLYAITALKISKSKMHYELKVCVNGEIRFDYADENGNIVL